MWGHLHSALLLHGLTGGPQEMNELGEKLRAKGLQVSIPTLAGHQSSIEELCQTKVERWLSDVRAEFNKLEPPAALIGLSFGSLLCIHLAEQFPELVSGLVLLSPPFQFRSPKEFYFSALSYLPEAIFSKLGTIKKAPRPGVLALPRHAYDRHSISAVLRLLKIRRMVLSKLKALRAPTLLIQDPFDHHLSADSYKRFSDHHISRIRLLPNAQHELTLGYGRAQVFSEIESFLEGIANAA